MRLLAVDTASPHCSVAVLDSTSQQVLQRDREVTTHSEGLVSLIDETLSAAGVTAADLDALVCGRGPGSFTGLRIGMATVKGLCLAADKPLICVPSMVGVAGAVAARMGSQQLVAVVLDARRDELFCGLYRGAEPAGEEVVLAPTALRDFIACDEQVVLAGDGALRYHEEHFASLPLADGDCHAIQAGYLARHAVERAASGRFDDLAGAVPLYIRPPDVRMPSQSQNGRAAGESKTDVDEELLERLRNSGLRLDRQGRWWHEGVLVEHERLARALHRWLDRLDDGRYIVRVDEQRFVYVEVEDAPYLVRTIVREPGEEPATPSLLLSDDSDERLDPLTLAVGDDGVLYCRVKQGRFEARFGRNAQLLMAESIELIDGDEDAFALRADGELVPLRRRRSPIAVRPRG